MSRSNIRGRLISSSHLFYLSKDSRVFILRLEEEGDSREVKSVFCSLSPSLRPATRRRCKEILMKPPYRRILSITKTKPVKVSASESISHVFQLTAASVIMVEESDDTDLCVPPTGESKLGMLRHEQNLFFVLPV